MGATHFSGPLIVTSSITSGTPQTDYQQFVGLANVIYKSSGTWTTTRTAAGDYCLSATIASSYTLGVNLTPEIRTTANKGFELTSIDYIYNIGTAVLTTHTPSLYQTSYSNNVAVSPTSISLTGTAATATQTNDYVTNLTVTPSFLNTSDSQYFFEVALNSGGSSVYKFIGLNLNFTWNGL